MFPLFSYSKINIKGNVREKLNGVYLYRLTSTKFEVVAKNLISICCIYVYVQVIFRTPGGIYKKISACCHDIHKDACITLICRKYYIQYLRLSSASRFDLKEIFIFWWIFNFLELLLHDIFNLS